MWSPTACCHVANLSARVRRYWLAESRWRRGRKWLPMAPKTDKKGLHVLDRLEALHHSLSLTNGKVRILSTIVQAFVATVTDVGQDSPEGRWVTRQLVGDHDSRLVANTLDDLAQEPFGSMLIPPRLDQDVEHDAVLVDG